jgi:flagellum-specific ATP synthase
LPKLLERSGTSQKGSITGVYTILVDGDDMDEPVSDTVRGILDGHVVLTRKLAERYHYPAVDVLKSISRLSQAVTGPITQKAMGAVRKLMATYEEAEDMINIGAYVKGTNPGIDEAIAKRQAIEAFLMQLVDEKAPIADTIKRLGDIAGLSIPQSELTVFAEPDHRSHLVKETPDPELIGELP